MIENLTIPKTEKLLKNETMVVLELKLLQLIAREAVSNSFKVTKAVLNLPSRVGSTQKATPVVLLPYNLERKPSWGRDNSVQHQNVNSIT